MIEEAAPKRGALVILPEMFASGFSMNVHAAADEDGALREFLAGAAREFGVLMMGGVVTRAPDGRGENRAIVFSPDGKQVANYSKMHPFRLGGEADHYAAGDAVVTFDWAGVTVAPLICYDLRFPEVFRAAMRKGAEVMTVIASWPLPREEHWVTLLKARAIENLAYVAGVNRAGTDPKYSYFGRSMLVDPKGVVLAEAGREQGVIRAEVDVGFLRGWRKDFPALEDARADLLNK
jgi:predicted amidohydrolase